MFREKVRELMEPLDKMERIRILSTQNLQVLLEKSTCKDGLEIEEILTLIKSTRSEENQKLILDFAAHYRRPHDREILLLPPLYFSSNCENQCLYCDFSSDGARLSSEEFLAEFNSLLEMGYRSIELVSSQDEEIYRKKETYSFENQLYDIHPVLAYFRLASMRLEEVGGGMLTSNIPPLDRESLRALKAVGLDCYLLWVETFHPLQYQKLHHKSSPKGNQSFRLDSFELAIEAGIPHIAGAFLKGLYDWRKEEVLLYAFNQYLKSKNGKGFSIIGTPRLKGDFAHSPVIKPFLVSDNEYELNIALDRILFDGVLWLQTRETPQLNRHLIDRYGAGIILTLDCSTAPGGYHSAPRGRGQFPVYRQNLEQGVEKLRKGGFTVLFNWNSQTLSGFQRK